MLLPLLLNNLLEPQEGVDALSADDVESTSEVSSPSLGQAHVLNATDVQSTSSVSVPVIGQVHDLTPSSVESASEVGSPALGIGTEVPDVVGETQAAGTTELETALFVVSVTTAYSPTIAVGLIISQDPAGGEFAAEGSTVAIVVSLGPEPSDEQPSGGWAFYNDYEIELRRRRKRKKERDELEAETERIQNELDRAIAQELRKQEALDEKRADLNRLKELAKKHADLEAARQYSERVATAYARAITKGNFSALEALDRELQRAREEDEFMAAALVHFLH